MYDAFGDLIDQSGTSANAYLYAGQQFDDITGLYSMRARMYAPGAGRFLSRDVWPYDYQNPLELNRYVYAANNPVRWTDPSGYSAFSDYGLTLRNAGVAVGLLLAVEGSCRVADFLLFIFSLSDLQLMSCGITSPWASERRARTLQDLIDALTDARVTPQARTDEDTQDRTREREDGLRSVRVRHYSRDIMSIMMSRHIGLLNPLSVFAEYPIVTPRTEVSLLATYEIYRPGQASELNGVVEFNVDLNKWLIIPDRLVREANAVEIIRNPLDIEIVSWILSGAGFSLLEPDVDPEFFDVYGNLIEG